MRARSARTIPVITGRSCRAPRDRRGTSRRGDTASGNASLSSRAEAFGYRDNPAAIQLSNAAAVSGAASPPAKRGGKKKLLLLAVPILLALVGGGLWFSGILPGLLGMGPKPAAKQAADQTAASTPAVYVELPEIVANLNAGLRCSAFIKLQARLQLARAEDKPALLAAMPRLLDMFQTYLREMHPEELRGSAGTWRLREALIARANIAAAPARVTDVLFTEMLIQ
jgi:flagellar FliL protein